MGILTGSVFRGMAVLASGNAVAKLVGVISLPILTRLYTPADFGVMAVFLSLILLITPMMTLRYVLAIPLPRRDGTAINLLALSTIILIFLGFATALFLWVFASPLMIFIGTAKLAGYWWLIVFGSIGGAIYEILSFWATRRRAYKIIARTSITQRVLGSAVKIGLGFMSFGVSGLLFGQIIEASGGILAMVRSFSTEFIRSWRHVRFSRIVRVAVHYASFPVYRVPSQFLMVFAKQLPLLGFTYLYDPPVAGALSLAMTTLVLPLALIGTAMGTALYAEAANLGMSNHSKIYEMVKHIQFRLFALSIAPALLLFLFGPQLFTIIFGSEWETAGTFASILAPVTVFQFASAPLMQLLNILKRQSIFLYVNLVRTVLVLGIFHAADVYHIHQEAVLGSYSILMTAFYVAISFLVMRTLKVGEAK